jgi:hypothetical protein
MKINKFDINDQLRMDEEFLEQIELDKKHFSCSFRVSLVPINGCQRELYLFYAAHYRQSIVDETNRKLFIEGAARMTPSGKLNAVIADVPFFL